MSVRVSFLYLSLFVAISCGVAEPVSYIKKCKPGDSKCIKESSQAALPQFTKMESLDPLHLSKLDASTSGLKLIITDAVVTGLKGCQIKKFIHDTEKNKFLIKAVCDVNLEGNYEMSGQLLILPMEGKGPIHVKLRKIQLNVDVDLEDKVKDGKKYWHIKSFQHTYELKDKADVEFENLFNGNEILSRTARDLIENSGNEIINEVGTPVIKSVMGGLVKTVNKFFGRVPLEDLVDYQ